MKQNLNFVLGILGVLGISFPLVFHFNNPSITQMQLLQEFWWLYLISVLLIWVGIRNK